jgi:TrmH family RNA methyltransferase
MISKATIRLAASLEHKKYREQRGLFLAEGAKLVGDLHAALPPYALFTTAPDGLGEVISPAEMRQLSRLAAPSTALGLFPLPPPAGTPPLPTGEGLTLALDAVQDPGNLGTIVRLCAWFGVGLLVCSPATADCYSPKAVQASMGAVAHVAVRYAPLPPFLREACRRGLPVYGTFLEGRSLYRERLPAGSIVVMGGEGSGISPEVAPCAPQRLTIPSFAQGYGAESLNVAIAAAVVCSEFRREAVGGKAALQMPPYPLQIQTVPYSTTPLANTVPWGQKEYSLRRRS